MRNTKRDLEWSVKSEILSEFSNSMMLSGYNEKFRLEIIQAAVAGYENQCVKSDKGLIPLHRPRDFDYDQRRKKKLMTKSSWYRPNDAVGFFPPTPKGILAKQIQSIASEESKRLNLSVKIVETGGVKIKQLLCKPDLTGCIFPIVSFANVKVRVHHTQEVEQCTVVCATCAKKLVYQQSIMEKPDIQLITG